MKYGFIEDYRSSLRVTKMCQALKVSRSGYYDWLSRSESNRSKENRVFLSYIRIVHEKSRQTYGSPRVTDELNQSGIRCGENRVANLMRENGIKAKRSRKFKVTTHSKHNYPVAPNLLNRQFEVSTPNAVWVSDITYIWTSEGWLYFAGVLDLYSRRIVGWSMSHRITEQLTLDALNQALLHRQPPSGLLHHSDRGRQYASDNYQKLLKTNRIVCSMSRKGDCWDNAVMESFFATLKTELIYRERFIKREDAKSKIFDYIEMFYNRKRRHSSLGYKSPVEFEMMEKPA
jgi:transposase InsO family protein